jgi:hypothetical protein
VIPDQPTPEELTTYFNTVRSQIKGAVVLVGPSRFVPVNLTPAPKRRADEDLKAAYDPANPNAGQRGRGQRGGRGPHHLSTRDEMLQRFAPSEMPAPPAARGGGQ